MGAVLLTLPAAPEKATSCNCSLCRRSGGICAYYEFETVSVQGHPGNTEDYIWGDRTLRNVRCKTCGIVTHWEPLEPRPGARQGVNLRNFEPELLESVAVRSFDGADHWVLLALAFAHQRTRLLPVAVRRLVGTTSPPFDNIRPARRSVGTGCI